MKKTSIKFKKLIAFVLAAVIIMSVATGCALVEYNEDRDLEQVVLKIESFEMEHKVPFYEDYKDLSGKVVKDADGKAVRAVMRYEDGTPVHKPKVENGAIVYQKDGNNVIVDQVSDEFYTVYNLANDEATGAVVYKFEGIKPVNPVPSNEYEAVWKNTVTGAFVRSDCARSGVVMGTKAYGLPTVHFTKADGSDWYYSRSIPVYATEKWNTDVKEYTKQELKNYYARSGQSLLDEGRTLELAYKALITTMTTMYFMELEAENHILSGEIEWGLTEENNVKKAFYSSIDSELRAIYADIYNERGSYSDSATEDEANSTYPKPVDESRGVEKDFKVWHPNAAGYHGLGANKERTSLVREGMKRWITRLVSKLEGDYTVSENVRKEFNTQLSELKALSLDETKIDGIYGSLLDKNTDGDYKYRVIWYLYGENNEKNIKSSALTNYIGARETVDSEDVKNRYNDLLADQKRSFNSNVQSYHSAVDNDANILYFLNDDYFYVKHILLPFPATASNKLTAYKSSNNFSDKGYDDLRYSLASMDNRDKYPVYRHVDGEDDKTVAYTVREAYNHIKSVVSAAATAKEKERAFEDMIFLYNTDPGIFNKEMGYSVATKSAEDGGPDEKFVIEFATAARNLRNDYVDGVTSTLGAISAPVLGDYGYHILYLLKVPSMEKSERGLYDYLTAGEYSTVYDTLSANLLTAARDAAFNEWSTRKASEYNKTDYVIDYVDRYKELYEDKTANS